MGIPINEPLVRGMGLVFLSWLTWPRHRQQLKMLVNRRRPVGGQLPDLTSPKKLWTWPKQNHAKPWPKNCLNMSESYSGQYISSYYHIVGMFSWVTSPEWAAIPKWILDEAPRESLGNPTGMSGESPSTTSTRSGPRSQGFARASGGHLGTCCGEGRSDQGPTCWS